MSIEPDQLDKSSTTPFPQALDGQAAAQETKEKRQETGGEIAFDRIVYNGIGFGVNEGSSLWITDQFMYGEPKFGKWFSKQGFDALSEKIARSFHIKDGVDALGKAVPAKAKAGNMLLMVTLLSGGTLLILPMKWLEDHKIYWANKANHVIDRLRGSKMTKEEVAARDKEVEQAIACSKRQSWPSMMMGRLVACLSSVGTGTFLMGQKNNERLMNWSEKLLTGSLQPEGQRNGWHRYARLLSVETYSCAISSFVLEKASKLFARHGKHVHDPQLCQAKAEQPPAPAEQSDNEQHRKLIASIIAKSNPKDLNPASFAEKRLAQKTKSEPALV